MIDGLCAQQGLRSARETHSLIRCVTVSMAKAGVKCAYVQFDGNRSKSSMTDCLYGQISIYNNLMLIVNIDYKR